MTNLDKYLDDLRHDYDLRLDIGKDLDDLRRNYDFCLLEYIEVLRSELKKCYKNQDIAYAFISEVKRLRKQLVDCKRQIQFTADWIRDRGEGTHAKELDEFLEVIE